MKKRLAIFLPIAIIAGGCAIYIVLTDSNLVLADALFAIALASCVAIWSGWTHIFWSFLIFILFIELAATAVPGMIKNAPKHNESFKAYEIVALKDSTQFLGSISGNIFVVSGYINEKPVYYFYKVQNGGYVLASIPADNTIVYEDTDGTGYIATVWTVINDDYFKKQVKRGILSDYDRMTQTGYEIHIPPNSVTRQFSLTLPK